MSVVKQHLIYNISCKLSFPVLHEFISKYVNTLFGEKRSCLIKKVFKYRVFLPQINVLFNANNKCVCVFRIRKYREPIKRSLMTLYKKQGKDSGGNEWVCTNCDLTFDNPSLLNLHTLTHAAEDLAMVDLNSTLAPSVVPGVSPNQAVEMLLGNSVAGSEI